MTFNLGFMRQQGTEKYDELAQRLELFIHIKVLKLGNKILPHIAAKYLQIFTNHDLAR
jgi:hypothetical protein